MKRATIHAIRPEDVERPPVGAPGVVLGGKYRLDKPIARGGMARVWRASHITLQRPVAVKFIESLGATPEERVACFLQEAKVAASVRHKNVVAIIDFGVVSVASGDEEPYMVMELLEGQTLEARLADGAMDTAEVVSLGLQILNGLDAVHRAEIVHRDLKPGNVFLTDDHDGLFARLLDFGISQGAGDAGTERMVVGTPEYMSPEQAYGDPLDPRSDIYSVGVMLYEMLTGILPFDDDDPRKIVELVAHGTPPDIARLRPDLPEFCKVVQKAMAREPADRYDSARAMRRALLDFRTGGAEATGQHRVLGTQDGPISGTMRVSHPTLAAAAAAPPALVAGDDASAPLLSTEGTSGSPSARHEPAARPRMPAIIGTVVALVAIAVGTAVWATSGAPETTPSAAAPHSPEAPTATAPAPEAPEPVAAALEPPAPVPEAPADVAAAEPEHPAVRPAPESPGRSRRSREHSGGTIVHEADF